MKQARCRKDLSAKGLLQTARNSFEELVDSKHSRGVTLADTLMAGLAMFGLKYPSLLQFDRACDDETVRHNLRTLYGIQRAPCDTYFRERLDSLLPQATFAKVYKRLFALLQRGKGLVDFQVVDGYHLLSVDGTGVFSSHEVHCDHCCEKHHRDGRVTYYHQLLAAVLVHPQCREVIPLMPEPIRKADGASKNDCERNAAKRLLRQIRQDHPHLKLLVVEDGLASNGPHIRLLQSLGMAYLLGAKASDHKFLFEWVEATKTTSTHEVTDDREIIHRFRYLNGAPLNHQHFELEVNFLEYWEIHPNGKVQHFSWVTDIEINTANLIPLMRAARARWKIENETFNTLKNQGYHLEHNFGHGRQHLSTVMTHLMMLAFLIDQIQLRCCAVFNQALEGAQSRSRLWRKMAMLFDGYLITSWEHLYCSIAHGLQAAPLIPKQPP